MPLPREWCWPFVETTSTRTKARLTKAARALAVTAARGDLAADATATIVLAALLAPTLLTNTAAAQAGAVCSGMVCGLGGQIRGAVGDSVPLPISIGSVPSGHSSMVDNPFTAITIRTLPASGPEMGLPFVGQGLGYQGQIKPTPTATIMQTLNPGTGPRQLTMAPGVFHYDGQEGLGFAIFNPRTLSIRTQGVHDFPHPGTTASGGQAFTEANKIVAIPTPNANVLFAGGRIGARTVTFYIDATALGSPTNNFGHGVPPPTRLTPDVGLLGSPPIHGIARFSATGNQFGGQIIGRKTGTVRHYFNGAQLSAVTDLPCKVTATPAEGTSARGVFVPFYTGTDCRFSLSVRDPVASDGTVEVAGGAFNGVHLGSGFVTNTGVFTGTIGFNGTILNQGAPVTAFGMGIPFAGDDTEVVGFPMTTGRLTISVIDTPFGSSSTVFFHTGTDARDANGNGVVALVTGSLTARGAFGNSLAGRTLITLEIPEPSAVLSTSAALLVLFGYHQLVRRRG